MTRIFDALRKAQVRRAPMAPAPTAVPGVPRPPATFPRPVPPRPVGAPTVVSRFTPCTESLVAIGDLPNDVHRQMTSLRVGIESALGDRMPRIVLILASHAGEGSSTVACQFALALAREGRQRTLLVDVNASHPSLGGGPGWFATRAHAGAGAGSGGEGTLDVLALPDEARQAGAFSLQLAREILETLAPRYEWVVLDGPPALETPEAAALSAVADGSVVVVQAGRTKRPVLTRTVDLLRKAGGRVLGTVLNRRRLEIPGFIYRRL